MKAKAIDIRTQRNILPYAVAGLVLILGIMGYLLAGMPTFEDFGRWSDSLVAGVKNAVALPQEISAYNDQRDEAENQYNQEFYQKSLASSTFIYDSLNTDNQRLYLDLALTYDRSEDDKKAFKFYEKTIQNSTDNYLKSVAYQQCGNLIFRAIFPSVLNLNPKNLDDKQMQELAQNWLEKANYGQKNAKLFSRERKLLKDAFQKDKKFACQNYDRDKFSKMFSVPAMLEASDELRSNQSTNLEILSEFCHLQNDDLQTLTERQLIERGMSKSDMMLNNENFTRLDKTELQSQAQGEVAKFLKSGNPNISRVSAEKFLQIIRTTSRKKTHAIENSQNPETARYLVDFYEVIMEFYIRALKVFPQNDEARMNYEILKKIKNKAEKKSQQLQENQPEKSEEEKKKEEQEKQDNQKKNQEENQKKNESDQNQNQSDNQKNNQDKKENSQTEKKNQQGKNQQSNDGESTDEDAKDAQNSQGKGSQEDGSETQEQQSQAGESKEGDKEGTKEIKDVTELRSKNKNYENGDASRAQQSLKALEEREVQYLQQMQRRPRRTQPKRQKADW